MIDFQDASYLMRTYWVGVYLLSFEGAVVYVGKSISIPTRVREHVKSNKMQFDKVYVQYCSLIDLDDLEYTMIRRYRPMHNITDNEDIPAFEPFDLVALGLVKDPHLPKRKVPYAKRAQRNAFRTQEDWTASIGPKKR